jgi:hypothetical protein
MRSRIIDALRFIRVAVVSYAIATTLPIVLIAAIEVFT